MKVANTSETTQKTSQKINKNTKYLPLQFLPAADMFSIQVGFAFEIKFSINDLIEIIVSLIEHPQINSLESG